MINRRNGLGLFESSKFFFVRNNELFNFNFYVFLVPINQFIYKYLYFTNKLIKEKFYFFLFVIGDGI